MAKSLFFPARSKWYADRVNISSPQEFARSIANFSRGGLSVRERRALILAQNRAKASLNRKNLSPEKRRQFLIISRMQIPQARG